MYLRPTGLVVPRVGLANASAPPATPRFFWLSAPRLMSVLSSVPLLSGACSFVFFCAALDAYVLQSQMIPGLMAFLCFLTSCRFAPPVYFSGRIHKTSKLLGFIAFRIFMPFCFAFSALSYHSTSLLLRYRMRSQGVLLCLTTRNRQTHFLVPPPTPRNADTPGFLAFFAFGQLIIDLFTQVSVNICRYLIIDGGIY